MPRAWLKPAAALAEEENTYVSSLEWGRPVTAFALGDGRVGLHLSSYTIASEGSAMAAAGRDLFLIHDPGAKRLLLGLDLGETKGRVRVDGCFSAWYHRFQLGDVDCDGRLDLGVVEERIDCNDDENEEETPYLVPSLRIGELRWFVLGDEGWRERPGLAGRLACFGMRAFPPLGVAQSPVDWVLGMTEAAAAAAAARRLRGGRGAAERPAGGAAPSPSSAPASASTCRPAGRSSAPTAPGRRSPPPRRRSTSASTPLPRGPHLRPGGRRAADLSTTAGGKLVLHTVARGDRLGDDLRPPRPPRPPTAPPRSPRRLVYYLPNNRRELVTITSTSAPSRPAASGTATTACSATGSSCCRGDALKAIEWLRTA